MAALSETRTLTLHPLLKSNHSDHILWGLVNILVTISDIQREVGVFQAALTTSHEALAVARDLKHMYPFIKHSLVDDNAYDDATIVLQEVVYITSSHDTSELVWHLCAFGVVHAHAAIACRPSFIVISAIHPNPGGVRLCTPLLATFLPWVLTNGDDKPCMAPHTFCDGVHHISATGIEICQGVPHPNVTVL